MENIIIDNILTETEHSLATGTKPIDWDCLDFGGDTRSETQKFQEKWPNFDEEFYMELAKREDDAMLKERRNHILKYGLLIVPGRFLISFNN